MSRKSKVEEEQIPTQLDSQVVFKFEDLTVSKTSENILVINKALGGISDSTYSMTAVGSQKLWCLYNEGNSLVETGSQKGNRSFAWSGTLSPGIYTLTTGPSTKEFTKHRVPGRGYSVTFRI
jgi:hypothetical protein